MSNYFFVFLIIRFLEAINLPQHPSFLKLFHLMSEAGETKTLDADVGLQSINRSLFFV